VETALAGPATHTGLKPGVNEKLQKTEMRYPPARRYKIRKSARDFGGGNWNISARIMKYHC